MKNIFRITIAFIAFSMTSQYYAQSSFGFRAGLGFELNYGTITNK